VAAVATSAIPSNASASHAAQSLAQNSATSKAGADDPSFGAMLAQLSPVQTQPRAVVRGSQAPSSATPGNDAKDTRASASQSQATSQPADKATSPAASTLAAELQAAAANVTVGNPAPVTVEDNSATPAIGTAKQKTQPAAPAVDSGRAPTGAVAADGDDLPDTSETAAGTQQQIQSATANSRNAVPAQITSAAPQANTGKSQLNALVQAAQNSVHRAATPQIAEAKAPPPQQTATGKDPVQTDDRSQTGTGGSDSGSPQNHAGDSPADSNDNPAPQSPAQLSHDAVAAAPVVANTGLAAGLSAPVNAANSAAMAGISAGAPAAATNATLQVGPASQNAGASAQPDIAALALNIAAKSQDGAKQFDISLDPPELGRVDVRLTVDNAGKAQARLSADRPETLQMLQRDSGTLARALKDSGVQLANNGLQFSLKGQEKQGDGAAGNQLRGKPLAISAVSSAEPVGPLSSTYGLASSRAGVDIRV
jgi:flagellar hook-length control protein FliK